MSQEQAENEVKYKMAFTFLKKLLDQGFLNLEEFTVANKYIAEKYKPLIPQY